MDGDRRRGSAALVVCVVVIAGDAFSLDARTTVLQTSHGLFTPDHILPELIVVLLVVVVIAARENCGGSQRDAQAGTRKPRNHSAAESRTRAQAPPYSRASLRDAG